jgi:hypothetical protein
MNEMKPKTPTIGTETISAKCGHTIALDLYEKDPHRDGRRQKAASRDCPSCRAARALAEATMAAEKRARKRVAAFKPRLPDGASFHAIYDAAATMWTGSLTVDGALFESRATSLKKLTHRLDDAYRATL